RVERFNHPRRRSAPPRSRGGTMFPRGPPLPSRRASRADPDGEPPGSPGPLPRRGTSASRLRLLDDADRGRQLARLRHRELDPRDLDQVDPDEHYPADSSQSGSPAIESITLSGFTVASSSTSSRNLPVRTSTVRRPNAAAPATSTSTSSPTIQVCSGSYSSAS